MGKRIGVGNDQGLRRTWGRILIVVKKEKNEEENGRGEKKDSRIRKGWGM